jgi:hypothetical protein
MEPATPKKGIDMLRTFLENHRSDLLDRCETRVLGRSGPLAPFRGTDSASLPSSRT